MSLVFKSFYLRLLIGVILVIICISAIAYLVQPLQTVMQNPNRVIVYSALPEASAQEYLAPFTAEHPEIEIELVDKVTLALTEQLLAERNNPQADVIWGLAVTSMLPLEWNHLLASYSPQGLERVSPVFRDVNDPPQWVGISARSVVLCINTDELTRRNLPKPRSWQDLIDPSYKGHLLMLAPGQTTVGYLFISLFLQLYGDIQGWEYLGKLHENAAGIYANDAGGVCELVRNGEYPIGITYDYRAAFPDDEKMIIVIPQEGIGWDMEVNALVRKEEIKPAAKIFLDWAISDSAMQQYAKYRVLTSAETEKQLVGHLPVEAIRDQLFDLDLLWIAANRERIQSEWTALYGANIELIDTNR